MTTQTPQKWKKVKLSDLGSVERGRSRHRPRNDASLYGGAYPFIQTGDIKSANFYIDSYSQTYSEKGLAQSKLWNPDTLCITIAANIGESAILKIPACFPDSVVGFQSYENVSDVRYVKYLLDLIKKQFQAISQGTTQDNLSLEKLLSINLDVPEYLTQKQIADVLCVYDNLIANNSRRIKILEKISQKIYTEWFVDLRFHGYEKLKFEKSGLPEGWEVKKVEDLIKRIPAGKKYDNKTVDIKGKIPVLDQGKTGVIGYHNDAPGVIASVDNPVIVFANHTCYQNLIMLPFSAIQNVLPFVPADERDIYWLHFATKDLISFNDYKGHWPEFMTKRVVVPTVEMTHKFGKQVRENIISKYKLEILNESLKETRDLLIPQLVTGKLQ